ncbi:BolA family protein [Govanella unica]|uniref:BolA family transcriptional regulator n=1 Tax=Govanella unica TaxID=2975056 RepID=A0A9X3Z643_9PROT|nr:BolA family protein [Govania unica]MDA5192559.1 BolA family transcriptional regulator [Govania unica]
MTMAERIRTKIESGLQPLRLEIINESHKHMGHGGYHPSGESHFKLVVVAAAFAGQSRVNRQRAVYALLADELADTLHALALSTLTPDEDAASEQKSEQ